MYFILSIFLCTSSFLFSLEEQQTPPSLVNMTSMPSSVVGGVNVITGDFIEYDNDYVVSGPDAYTIGHTYVSSSLEAGSLGDGWNFLHDHILEIVQPAGIKYVARDASLDRFTKHEGRDENSGYPIPGISKKWVFAHLDEAFGGKLTFEGEFHGNSHKPKLDDFEVVTKHTGFTNVSGGKISGQTNVKNIRLHWNRDGDSWDVTTGDGTKRHYNRQWKLSEMKSDKDDRKHAKTHRDYHLVRETKPSGNYIEYEYNNDHAITRMRLFNKKGVELSHVHFQQNDERHLPVTNSDLQTLQYDFSRITGLDHRGKKLKETFGVTGIKRPGLPYVRFIYDEKSKNHIRRLERKEFEDGNFVEVKYYRPHTNSMGNRKPKNCNSKKTKNFNKNRVRYVATPVGLTHSFEYYPDGKNAGHADVFDAHNARTRYYWNKDKRLTKIERFNNDSNLEMAEEFVWGKGKNDGHLMAQTVFDGDYKPKYARKFVYDKRGNILKETLEGKFCTNSGSDKLITRYTYSDDGFNLKTSERDPEGNYTYYRYVKGTNLLKAKLICDKKKICRREFYRYDESAILIEKIVDDGSLPSKTGLADVTEQHITKITPRKQSPHYGEPESIEEYAFDTLLQRIEHTFNDKGFVVEKRLFGADGKLASVTKFDYDDVGRITFIQDPSGRVERYSYNKSGLLEKKELPSSTTHYTYDLAGRLISEEEQIPGKPTLTQSYSYDKLGRKVHEIDPQNNHTFYEYDALNRITKITHPPIYDQDGKKITPTKKFEYHKLGTVRIATDENGYKITTIYNAAGKVLEEHFSDGTKHYCTYDKKGNLIKEVLPNGVEQTMTYDAFGRITSTTLLDATTTRIYNSFHLIKEISPTGEIVRYKYDKAGRKIKSSLNNSREQTFHYDSLGRLEEEHTEATKKKYCYDACDRVIGEFEHDAIGTLQSYQLFGYDEDGNRTTVEIPVQGTLAITKTTFMAQALPTKHTDALGNTWHYEHDLIALKKRTTDPQGVVQEERFDAHGNLSVVTMWSPFGKLLAKKELFYDAVGNCTCTLEHSIVNGASTKVIKTLCTYGPNNRLDKIVEAAGTPEAKTTIYQYNKLGQKECTLHADGTKLYNLYDAKGRVAQFYAKDKSLDYSYLYDASDKILEVTNNLTGNKTIRTYNTLGELASETLESGLTVGYGYDTTGRVSNLELPDATSIGHEFSGGYLKSVSRISTDKNLLWQHTIVERDLSGKPLTINLPHNAGTLKGSHDTLLRTTKLEHPRFMQEATLFDSVGNVKELTTDDALGKVHARFSYDFLSQLTSEEGFANHTYKCDSLYDRLQLDDKVYKSNSLHSVLSDSERTFEYDERGNRLSDGSFTYSYDALDRLIEVNAPGQRYVYSYDAFDRRIAKTSYIGDVVETTRYLYTLQNEIGAVDEQGTITELRILGEGLGAEIGASVGIELQNKLYVPLHDLRGNIVALLNPQTAAVEESYRYDTFGNELQDKSMLGNPWRFSSKRVDNETGLVNFGRRYYDPSLGKWLTMDPLGLKAGPNLYAYVLNNPIRYFDEYGLIEGEESRASRMDRIVYTAQHGCGYERDLGVRRDRESLRNDYERVRQEFACFKQFVHEYPCAGIERDLLTGGLCASNHDHIIENASMILDSAATVLDSFSLALLFTPLFETSIVPKTGSVGCKFLSSFIRWYLTGDASVTSKKVTYISSSYFSKKNGSTFIVGSKGFFGNRHWQLKFPAFQNATRNTSTVIEGRQYTGHAIDQMQNRGFVPSVIENTIQRGQARPDVISGRRRYYEWENKITVIVEEKTGKVITAIPGDR